MWVSLGQFGSDWDRMGLDNIHVWEKISGLKSITIPTFVYFGC